MTETITPFTLPETHSNHVSKLEAGGVVAWSEAVSIPTYEPWAPDRYPMFLSRRVYQGSSGRVYPIPFIDKIATDAVNRTWQAIHLENKWIRLMILPELGGRIHIGYDKAAGYDFFYRNNVIKPALVGLAGPWVSGGVEFNWPQHHRPATFLPVDTHIEQHEDGAVTVWCSDHDPFTRMKGMHGIRLHPERATVELVVKLHNRTSETQTFLWWANVAARVHEKYQSFFPTDVQFVADHARRAISRFPEADRPYYGVDYPALGAGKDRLDFYTNIPVPTSYMILETQDDFFGGYDHAAEAGFVHIADRRIAPGKKQWTWGNHSFGHAWDDLLTDGDGPYVELMAGVYTDNQPDFAWLRPGETKNFTQTWYPIQAIGVVHQANLEAAVHLDITEGIANFGVATTSARPAVTVTISDATSGAALYSWLGSVEPGKPHTAAVSVTTDLTNLVLEVKDNSGSIIRWQPRPVDPSVKEPEIATEPPRPDMIESVDELYLTGVHLTQYRHPTRSPIPYFLEGIKRDAGDARCNLALADYFYRSGEYVSALKHAKRALARLTRRNSNPADGETSYLLGLILLRSGDQSGAYDAFAKASWDGRCFHAAQFEMARLDAQAGDFKTALNRVRQARLVDAENSRARGLEVVILRRLGDVAAAESILLNWLAQDPLDQTARALNGMDLTSDARTRIDIALDLASFGESEQALILLETAQTSGTAPIALYHCASILDSLGRFAEAESARAKAQTAPSKYCFPNGLEDQGALNAAIDANASDVRAHSLLGMLLYDRGREQDALNHWTAAIEGGLSDAVTFRNAAIATYNTSGDSVTARQYFESALVVAPLDARLWYESDQLLAITGSAAQERLARLEPQRELVLTRDDLTIEFVELLTAVGRAEEAYDLLTSRNFAPWEGGEGRCLAAWERTCLALSEKYVGEPQRALAFGDAALDAPRNLGEARHILKPTLHIQSVRAAALVALGRSDEAEAALARAIPEPPAAEKTLDPDYFATSLPELLLFDWPRSSLRTPL